MLNAGTDCGQWVPMVDQLQTRYQQRPAEYLADGGFIKLSEITQLESSGTTIYLPVMELEDKRNKGIAMIIHLDRLQ